MKKGINRDLVSTNWYVACMVNPEKFQTLVLDKTDCEMVFKKTLLQFQLREITIGVIVDYKLKFDSHVGSICRKVGC